MLLMQGMTGCLLKQEEDPFVCDKNAVVKQDGEQKCAFARVTQYSVSESGNVHERIIIGISWSTSNLQLGLELNDRMMQAGASYVEGQGATFGFPGLNKLTSARISISQIDREAKTVSGSFMVEGEGGPIYDPYSYKAEGHFDAVSFAGF